MFHDPVLDNGISHRKGFFAAYNMTLRPFSEVVLHGNDVIVVILGLLERSNQIHRDTLIERAIGGLLQMLVSMHRCFPLSTD